MNQLGTEEGFGPVDTQHCGHCGETKLSEELAFCPRCGQRFLEARLTVPALVRDFFARITNLDRGLWPTIRQLTIDPGGVSKEWVMGNRRRYVHPMTYCLLAVAFAVLMMGFVADSMEAEMLAQINNDLAGEPEKLDKVDELLGPNFRQDFANRFITIMMRFYTPFLLLMALPLALLLRLFHGRPPVNPTLAESGVFSLYIISHGAVLSSAFAFLIPMIGLNLTGMIFTVLRLGLTLLGSHKFYGPGWWRGLRTAAAFVLSFLGFLIIVMMVVAIAVFYVLKNAAGA